MPEPEMPTREQAPTHSRHPTSKAATRLHRESNPRSPCKPPLTHGRPAPRQGPEAQDPAAKLKRAAAAVGAGILAAGIRDGFSSHAALRAARAATAKS